MAKANFPISGDLDGAESVIGIRIDDYDTHYRHNSSNIRAQGAAMPSPFVPPYTGDCDAWGQIFPVETPMNL